VPEISGMKRAKISGTDTGTTKHLPQVTDVRIIDRNGVVIEGKLNLHHRVPRETDRWLEFVVS
jgi:hypothetical protein